MLSFKFTPSPNDFTRALWTFYLNNWILWAILILTTVILGACGLFSFVSATPSYLVMVQLFLSFVLTVFLIFSLLIRPYLVSQQVQHDERLNSPVEYQVGEEHLFFKNRFSETKLDWGSYNRVIESPELFLLSYSTNKNMFQIIPKRAFPSTADEQAFQSLLKSKISGSYSKGVSIEISPSVLTILDILLGISALLCATVVFFLIQIRPR